MSLSSLGEEGAARTLEGHNMTRPGKGEDAGRGGGGDEAHKVGDVTTMCSCRNYDQYNCAPILHRKIVLPGMEDEQEGWDLG